MAERLDQRQFERVAAAIAATLATHLAHLPLWLSLPVALALMLRVWMRRRGSTAVSPWIRLPLTALLVVLVITSYGNVFGRGPGSVLACGLLALKLLETEKVRDARVALGFSAFVLMSALLFTQTLLFSAAVVAVLVLLLAALAALQPAPLDPARSLRADLRLAALLLGTSLPLAAAAFVLLPRLGAPLWGTRGGDGQARSGLSETMAPGQFSDLMLDDSPAFRVAFAGTVPPQSALYFRTLVLTEFDGTTWSRWRTESPPGEAITPSGRVYDYQVTLEATERRWLPALDLPLDAPDGARLGADQILVAALPISQPREYHVRSAPQGRPPPVLGKGARARMLALPVGFGSKARALAQRWRTSLHDDDKIVKAALDLFHASFTYTLTPPLLARDSVDDFLFDTQQGFCEHYSSAFVFLMRASGIPARVVTGYQGGWWSRGNSYLLVRQADAHAWAEVWRDGVGWTRVDPTAAVSPARVELGAAQTNAGASWAQAEWLRALRNRFDFASRLWTQSIIRFDALRQRNLLTEFGFADVNHGDLLLALSGVLGVTMLLATLWAMRSTHTRRGDALDHAWANFGARLARAGIAQRPMEGPLDLRDRVHRIAPALAVGLGPLVDDYVALRYGAASPPRERVAEFAARLRQLPLQHASATKLHSAASR
jgi:transglutaminase-like putative cysteine protease